MPRYRVSSSFVGVVFSAEVAFSARSWPYVKDVAVPWLLCSGQRVMTRLASLGRHRRSLSSYYRFLSDGKWRIEVLFHSLFALILRTFPTAHVTLAVDDTLCPKWGRKIFGMGRFYDSSGYPPRGWIWGHNWVVLAVVVEVRQRFSLALPFWIELYRPRSTCRAADFRTRLEITIDALRRVRRWFPGPITVVADGSYGNGTILRAVRKLDITLVARVRCNTSLRTLKPPPKRPGRGRPPSRGVPLGPMSALARRRSAFRRSTVRIYGGQVPTMLREIDAQWEKPKSVGRFVIAIDPRQPKRKTYLVCTDMALSGETILETFARRWSIEQLFSVAKCQMGLDSAEVRTERSVRRHAALTMAMVTWVEVWAQQTGIAKTARSFHQKLTQLRYRAVVEAYFGAKATPRASPRIARTLGRLFATATAVA